ncbi:MAG: hypothetical protein J6S67_07150 [Methanobrevibacter sp.]|nr:hypothetical protein [Methanobrevibacter sp.]
MANEILNFTNTLLDSANTISSVVNDYNTKQAQLSTDLKTSQLQLEINAELARIQQSTNFEDWNKEINNFFEQKKNAMSDKNSNYYCQNNLQAKMFSSILDQKLISVTDHVNNLVIQEQREKNKIDVNKGIINNKNLGLVGQDLYDANKALLDKAQAVRTYSQAEYEQLNDAIFYDSYSSMYYNMFRDTAEEAIKRGDSLDKIWDWMQSNSTAMMKVDKDQMPAGFDKEALDNKIKNELQRDYNAKQQDIWNQTEANFANYYDNMLDQRTAEGRNKVAQQARYYIDSVKGTGLASPDQITKWTSRFVLEDYLDPAGTTTKSQAMAALSKLPAQSQIDFYIGQWKKGSKGEEGGIAGLYNAYNLFKDSVLKQAQAIKPDATWTDVEEACPVVMKFFEQAKTQFSNIPGMSDVIDNAKEMLEVIGIKSEALGSAMDIVNDMLFEVDVSDMDGSTKEKYVKRVAVAFNSLYGNELEKKKNYEWLKDEPGMEAITNFKIGVTGNEKNLAQALYTLQNNPDLVYKDKTQKVQEAYGTDIKRGLINIEAEEKNEIARYIKATEGRSINTGAISSDWEEDGAYDVKATRVYTIDNQQYRLSSPDGKSLVIETKKAGDNKDAWKPTQSTKQVEKQNSAGEAKDRKTLEKESDNKIMASTQMPKAMQAAGKFTDDDPRYDWANTNNIEDRQYMLRVTANRISSDASSMSEAEFKNKYGFTIQEWKKSSDERKRWDLIINSK